MPIQSLKVWLFMMINTTPSSEVIGLQRSVQQLRFVRSQTDAALVSWTDTRNKKTTAKAGGTETVLDVLGATALNAALQLNRCQLQVGVLRRLCRLHISPCIRMCCIHAGWQGASDHAVKRGGVVPANSMTLHVPATSELFNTVYIHCWCRLFDI